MATSQRILVDPAGWMRSPDPVGALGVLQAAVAAEIADLYSNVRLG